MELPVLAVGAVLQASLRAQQLYAELTARGDEAISQLRGAPDEPPAWASFDDVPEAAPVSADSQAPDGEDDEVGIVFGAADAALLVVTPPIAQPAVPTGAAGLHGPSAFDLADGDEQDDDDDRPLGD